MTNDLPWADILNWQTNEKYAKWVSENKIIMCGRHRIALHAEAIHRLSYLRADGAATMKLRRIYRKAIVWEIIAAAAY